VFFLWNESFGFGGIGDLIRFWEPSGVLLFDDGASLVDIARCGCMVHILVMWVCVCFLDQVGCVLLFGWLVLLIVWGLRCGAGECLCWVLCC